MVLIPRHLRYVILHCRWKGIRLRLGVDCYSRVEEGWRGDEEANTAVLGALIDACLQNKYIGMNERT